MLPCLSTYVNWWFRFRIAANWELGGTGMNNPQSAGIIIQLYAVDGRIQMSYERVFGQQVYVRDTYLGRLKLLVAC